MSKLKSLVSRGVRLIVADVPEDSAPPPDAPGPEREFPPETFEVEPRRVTRSEVAADVQDFSAVYEEAGIALPEHGYGIDRVAEMLQSKHLAPLGREVKAASVLAALEAAKVPMRDVIQDAVLRDRALDAFEAAKGREVQELHARTETRTQAIQEEIAAFLKERNTELEALKRDEEAANQAFLALQARKRTEEQRLVDLVGHFLAGGENPITTAPASAAGQPAPPPDPKTT
jgi:hypothetical protein